MKTIPSPSIPEPILDADLMPPSRSPWSETWRLLRKNRMAFSGLLIFAVFFVIALAGTFVSDLLYMVVDPRIRL